ncbi:hypothetical protein J6590_004820 [Homalodisca vitripennis]|nr:hypothetical protein J6590_004820 [Homalodisca vitripennis]
MEAHGEGPTEIRVKAVTNAGRRSSTDVGRPAVEEPIPYIRCCSCIRKSMSLSEQKTLLSMYSLHAVNKHNVTRCPESSTQGRTSKSRSVDHGFSSPFDLDSLRSKVESRFESVDRLSRGKSSNASKPRAYKCPRPCPPSPHYDTESLPLVTQTTSTQMSSSMSALTTSIQMSSSMSTLITLRHRFVTPCNINHEHTNVLGHVRPHHEHTNVLVQVRPHHFTAQKRYPF